MVTKLFSRRVLTDDGLVPATVTCRDGVIVSIDAEPHPDAKDLGDRVIMPGIVDTHVHVNEPGRTEWEGWETATAAAALGGVTTLADMPLNSIPVTTSLDALLEKHASMTGKLFIDCALWGGVIPGNAPELPDMVAAGVRGFKAFLCPSGIDEFPTR